MGLRYVTFTVTGPASKRIEVRVGVIVMAVCFAESIGGMLSLPIS